jgi:hypothetical protein
MTTIETIIITPFESGFPDKKPWRVTTVDDTLETWQHIVDGHIEHIEIDPDYTRDGFFLNEEGKYRNLDVNGVATFLARGVLQLGDYINGTVALIGPADEEGRNTAPDLEHWVTVLDHVWAIHGLHGHKAGEPPLHTANGPTGKGADDD